MIWTHLRDAALTDAHAHCRAARRLRCGPRPSRLAARDELMTLRLCDATLVETPQRASRRSAQAHRDRGTRGLPGATEAKRIPLPLIIPFHRLTSEGTVIVKVRFVCFMLA